MHSPNEAHLRAAYKIVCYLNATPRKELPFRNNKKLNLKVYTREDPTGSLTEGILKSNYYTFFNGEVRSKTLLLD